MGVLEHIHRIVAEATGVKETQAILKGLAGTQQDLVDVMKVMAAQSQQTAQSHTSAADRIAAAYKLVAASQGNQASQEKIINTLGVQTVQQMKERLNQIHEIVNAIDSAEIPALQRLAAEAEQLNLGIAQSTTTSRHAEQAMFSLGYVVQDSAQFFRAGQIDFSNGIRAIANNLQPLVQQIALLGGDFSALKKSLFGAGGLILALNLITTVMIALPGYLDKAGSAIKKLENNVDALVKDFVRLKDVDAGIFAEQSVKQAKIVRDNLAEMRDELQLLTDAAESDALSRFFFSGRGFLNTMLQAIPGVVAGFDLLDKHLIKADVSFGSLIDDMKKAGTQQRILNELTAEYELQIARVELRRRAAEAAIEAGSPINERLIFDIASIGEGYLKQQKLLETLRGARAGFIGEMARETIIMQEQVESLLGLNTQYWSFSTTARQLTRDLAELNGAHGDTVTALSRSNTLRENEINLIFVRGQVEDESYINRLAQQENELERLEKLLDLRLRLAGAGTPKKIEKDDIAEGYVDIAEAAKQSFEAERQRYVELTLLSGGMTLKRRLERDEIKALPADIQPLLGVYREEELRLAAINEKMAERLAKFEEFRKAIATAGDYEIDSSFLRQIEDFDMTEEFAALDAQDRALDKSAQAWESYVEGINRAINVGLRDAATGFLEGVGTMIAGTATLDQAFAAVLISLADTAIRVGKIAVGTGLAVAGIREALRTLDPAIVIAAGAALIVLGSAVKASLKGALQSHGSSGGVGSGYGVNLITTGPGMYHGPGGVQQRAAFALAGTQQNALTLTVRGRLESGRGFVVGQFEQTQLLLERNRAST